MRFRGSIWQPNSALIASIGKTFPVTELHATLLRGEVSLQWDGLLYCDVVRILLEGNDYHSY